MHDGALQNTQQLKQAIRLWGREMGLSAIAFAAPELGAAGAGLADWLAQGLHGEMDYMARNTEKREHPTELVAGTQSIIVTRLDYLPPDLPDGGPDSARISRYAMGRDYHKTVRQRLQRLAERIESAVGPFGYRAFADSAPVMEVELARLAGLGWRGKHTLLLSRSGSWFFLGELFTTLPLPPDAPLEGHCGHCDACLKSCPTAAFIGPYLLDARRCISYLTIEHAGPIPKELRPMLGARIYGCDDCQLACPWNRFARPGELPDFLPRNGLDHSRLADLFAWTESEFNDRLAGSPIRRIGHERWLRNIAVAIGNTPPNPQAVAALEARREHASAIVREHVAWAIERHRAAATA